MDPKAPPLAVTDTHALIWAIDGNRKRLGKHARKQFENADDGKCAIYIPAPVLAELGEACHEDRVTLAPREVWSGKRDSNSRPQPWLPILLPVSGIKT